MKEPTRKIGDIKTPVHVPDNMTIELVPKSEVKVRNWANRLTLALGCLTSSGWGIIGMHPSPDGFHWASCVILTGVTVSIAMFTK